MDSHQYKINLENGLACAFDFKEVPPSLQSYSDLWAVYNRVNEKYFLSKKVTLYSMNNDEYVSLLCLDKKLTKEFLEECHQAFSDYISSLKVPEGHMSSLFNLTIVSEEAVEDDVIQALSKLKFHKDFCFTFKGWADLAMLVVDLKNNLIHSNPKGKNSVENFRKFLK